MATSQAIYIPPGWWHSIRTHRPSPEDTAVTAVPLALSSMAQRLVTHKGEPKSGVITSEMIYLYIYIYIHRYLRLVPKKCGFVIDG